MMQALDYWKTVSMDRAEFLERLASLLAEQNIHYCVIGGQAVNTYVEPVVSHARKTWQTLPACSRRIQRCAHVCRQNCGRS